jgi:hypothetical protein
VCKGRARKIKAENKHEGQPVFILGCGWSLNEIDLEMLDPYTSIGVNRVVYAYHPTYWMFTDRPLVKEFGKEIDLRIINSQIICWENAKYNGDGVLTYSQSKVRKPERMEPEYNGLMFGNTTSYMALHLAYIMGADPIVFCGLDLCFVDGHGHFYDKPEKMKHPNFKQRRQSRAKVEYIRPDGRKFWTRNDFQRMERNIMRASKLIMSKGTRVYNCSPHSMLEHVPIRPLNSVIDEIKEGSTCQTSS